MKPDLSKLPEAGVTRQPLLEERKYSHSRVQVFILPFRPFFP